MPLVSLLGSTSSPPFAETGSAHRLPVALLLCHWLCQVAHRLNVLVRALPFCVLSLFNALATDYVLLRAFTIQLGARSVMLRIPLPEYDGFALTWLQRPNS